MSDDNLKKCPNCGTGLFIAAKEVLEPYTISLDINVEKGRMLTAKTAGGVLIELANLLQASGEDYDHNTEVFLSGASVDENMVSFSVCAVPVIRVEREASND